MKRRFNVLLASLLAITLGAVACAKKATPTEVAKAFAEAMAKEDNEAMKRLLSKRALQKLVEQEQKQNEPGVIMLQTAVGLKSPAQCRNEKIEGDRATVECESGSGPFPIPLIKENGAWRIHPPYAEK
ncbi:MAG TPA: DUF2950 family protein [Pyrinomonadaceae bacterium]